MYRVVLCGSNQVEDQHVVDVVFSTMSEAIAYIQDNEVSYGYVFTIHNYFGTNTCTYVHMVDSETINTMKNYKEMCESSIYDEVLETYDTFKDVLGIQEW